MYFVPIRLGPFAVNTWAASSKGWPVMLLKPSGA
jgi:hypothetical protein